MKRTILTISAVLLLSIGDAEACGRRRAACGCRHPRSESPQRTATPAPIDYPPPMTYPPAVAYDQMPAAPESSIAYQTPVPVQSTPTGAQPTYEYDPVGGGQAAYYYTYDNSGKLIVSRWMDWVFRGGRVAGLPAPPLPVIGALRNR